MQNRYAGDVGDFGKLGLLRQISSAGLRVGVNWYLVPDENGANDGKHIGYLSDARFSNCDDMLRDALKQLVENERSVLSLEALNLLNNAIYEHAPLGLPSQGFSRQAWHGHALKALAPADVVFLDPDNGLLTKSVSIGAAKSIKYVTPVEIKDYYQLGKSVIFYNHRCREKETSYLKRFEWLRHEPITKDATIVGIKFSRGTVRDYIFVMQPCHALEICKSVDKLLESNWTRHFAWLDFANHLSP